MVDQEHPWRDRDTLEQMYLRNRMTMEEIGDELGCSTGTIRNWLVKHDINQRMVLPHFHFDDGYAKITHGINGTQYHVQVHRLVAVAEHGVEEVQDKIVHHVNGFKWDNRPENLEVMTQSEHMEVHKEERLNNPEYPWQDEEVLHKKYVGEEMSMQGVGDELGCSAATVLTWLNKHEIETR